MNTTNSTVFEDASVSGSWASGQVTTAIDLTVNATTEEGVTQLNVIDSKSETLTTTLDSRESSATVLFPVNGPATVVAVNTINGTTVESHNVTVTGDTLF